MLSYKISFSKFQKIEIISNIFSYHSSMQLEVNFRNKNGKTTNTWKLKKLATKIPNELMRKSKRKSENILRQIEIQLFKVYGMQQKQF